MQRLDAKDFDRLLLALRDAGHTVIGPRVQDQAIVYAEIGSAADLPHGWSDEQAPGRYRIRPGPSDAWFAFASSPHSWKPLLFPPRERLFRADRDARGAVRFAPEPRERRKVAFLGVRACDIAAMSIQDRVFLEGTQQDAGYRGRRERALVVAVQCTASGETCFCASTHTGPAVRGGYDIVMTEFAGEGDHWFGVAAGTAEGERILARLSRDGFLAEAGPDAESLARAGTECAAQSQRRRIDPRRAKEALPAAFDHPRWDEVAARCVNCANCTLVCPTCFCSSVEDTTDLSGNHAERWRRWDSCFTLDHSFIHGGPVRPSAKSRYRQWLTHKLSTWWEQFGTSGCVGCGRCITWCPVGIDITEEAEALQRHADHQRPAPAAPVPV